MIKKLICWSNYLFFVLNLTAFGILVESFSLQVYRYVKRNGVDFKTVISDLERQSTRSANVYSLTKKIHSRSEASNELVLPFSEGVILRKEVQKIIAIDSYYLMTKRDSVFKLEKYMLESLPGIWSKDYLLCFENLGETNIRIWVEKSPRPVLLPGTISIFFWTVGKILEYNRKSK